MRPMREIMSQIIQINSNRWHCGAKLILYFKGSPSEGGASRVPVKGSFMRIVQEPEPAGVVNVNKPLRSFLADEDEPLMNYSSSSLRVCFVDLAIKPAQSLMQAPPRRRYLLSEAPNFVHLLLFLFIFLSSSSSGKRSVTIDRLASPGSNWVRHSKRLSSPSAAPSSRLQFKASWIRTSLGCRSPLSPAPRKHLHPGPNRAGPSSSRPSGTNDSVSRRDLPGWRG